MPSKSNSSAAVSYDEQIRQALNHFDDPQWLGEQSPLSAPYFLGQLLDETNHPTAVSRGKQLQRALLGAADLLWGNDPLPKNAEQLQEIVTEERRVQGNKGARYHFLLLELRYFRRYFKTYDYPSAEQEQDIRDFIGVGRGPYFNHAKAARQALGEALLSYAQPTFRLEQPPVTAPLIGREDLIQQCKAALLDGQTTAINGASGTGKTTVAAAVAAVWPAGVFWYTVRPGVNDEINSLLFSLGYFLHQHGSANLWRQLIADGGKIEGTNLALGHIRADIAELDSLPVLIFDELDHLRPEQEISARYVPLRQLISSLCETTSVLLLSQRPTFPAATHHELAGLDTAATATLLTQQQIDFTQADLQQLQAYTGGNPRLLHLIMGLHKAGETAADVLAKLPQNPDLWAVFDRLWHYLSPTERQLLQQLAVFPTPAPDDSWPEAQPALRQLTQQRLVQRDGRGGVYLLPVLYDLLNQSSRWLTAELREQNHLQAAHIRATRGEYTAAAYHFIEAGEPTSAIHCWFPQREQEFRRGQSGYAYSIFQPLSSRRLAKTEQEALALIRAELLALLGDPTSGRAEIEAVTWSKDSEMALRAQQLRGEFLNALGYPEQALDTYKQVLETIGRLLNQLGRAHYQRGLIYVQQKQLDTAVQEALLARYHAEHLQALVHDEQGRYEEAHRFYQRALALAAEANNTLGIAQTNRELAALFTRQGQLEEARAAAQVAIEHYQLLGDRLGQEKMRNVLAAIYFQGGQFEEVISTAHKALTFFEQAKLPYWAATTAATLSEAYFETGNLEQAEHYAHLVMRIEEPQSHPYALYTLGLVAQAREQLTQAIQLFQESQHTASHNGDLFMEAYAWQQLGQSYQQLRQMAEATAAWEQAQTCFLNLGMNREAEAMAALITKEGNT